MTGHITKAAAMATAATALVLAGPCWAADAAPSNSPKANQVTEVIVTAEKRSERLLETPVPVAVLSAQTLADTSQTRLSEYFNLVPGLSFNNINRGETVLAIRGVTTGGATGPTVGTVIDDIPFGGTTSGAFGFIIPEIDPATLSSVEVLRGPQGTLYGAASMGGLIKYTTRDPSTAGISGEVRAGTEAVSHASDLGYNVGASIIVPLGQTLAVRASLFDRVDAGYIDDPINHAKDVNKHDARGGRVSALWTPVDAFSLKLSALSQRGLQHGSNDANEAPGFGDLQQHRLVGTGFVEQLVQAYGAVASLKLGRATVTSLTGYSNNGFTSSTDFGVQSAGGEIVIPEKVKTDKTSQELRLEMPLTEKIDWLLGGFYTDEDTRRSQDLTINSLTTGAPFFLISSTNYRYDYKEYAVFTDFTAHVTDKLTLQVGARESRNTQVFSSVSRNGAGVLTPVPQRRLHDSSFTYLFTPSYKVSDNVMVYARLASGYRPGGPNGIIGGVVSPNFGPDTTKTYEVGSKGRVLDGALEYDASVYYIDWSKVQIVQLVVLNGAQGTLFTNGGAAKSEGAELTLNYHPQDGMTIGGWVSYNDAELTQSFPAGSPSFGASGDPLPYSSKWSGNLTFDDRFELSRGFEGSVGATLAYVGERRGQFQATPVRQVYPSYAQLNLRAGISRDDWNLTAYANNVTDKRGKLSGGIGFPANPTGFEYIQPRTIGVSLSRRF